MVAQKPTPHSSTLVEKWDTPILIYQGEDFRVPIGQGQEAFQAAQCNKVDSSTFQEESLGP
jgi:hypothetical protein